MQFWRLLRNRAQRRTAWRACVVHATDRYVEKRMRGYFDCWRVAAHCLKNKAPVEFEMPEVLDVVDFIRWVRAALTEQQRLRSMSLPHGDTLPLYASAVDDELLMPAVGTRESYLHPTRPLRAHPASAPRPLPHLHRDPGLPAPHPHRDLAPGPGPTAATSAPGPGLPWSRIRVRRPVGFAAERDGLRTRLVRSRLQAAARAAPACRGSAHSGFAAVALRAVPPACEESGAAGE